MKRPGVMAENRTNASCSVGAEKAFTQLHKCFIWEQHVDLNVRNLNVETRAVGVS